MNHLHFLCLTTGCSQHCSIRCSVLDSPSCNTVLQKSSRPLQKHFHHVGNRGGISWAAGSAPAPWWPSLGGTDAGDSSILLAVPRRCGQICITRGLVGGLVCQIASCVVSLLWHLCFQNLIRICDSPNAVWHQCKDSRLLLIQRRGLKFWLLVYL